ncbi:MAG TPA: 16S rRNA (uracil(1498)-N(3))-methyltransferase [Mycobacteriales bacterium]|nr:16S rRNA (uracil(1498)-N(3))-methyltransferase [Mycobacteriales bacterium]
MTPPLFFVSATALAADPVVVDGAEGRHAADVRRLQPGEAVCVGDGRGALVRGVVADVARGRVEVSVGERLTVPRADPWFVVVQAVAKGGRDLDAAEAMTEVGVDEVVGWEAARSVARWTERTSAKWHATVREAAKQSRRSWVPAVAGPLSTTQVAQRLEAAALAVVLHEDGSERLADIADRREGPGGLPRAGEVVLVVGPEGGVAAEELERFAAVGARVCRLGESVLRTSTAGVAALSVLSAAERWR